MEKVIEFKYLLTFVQSRGDRGKEVNQGVQAGWSGWTLHPVEKRVAAKVKGKVYKRVVSPGMMLFGDSGIEQIMEAKLELAAIEMLIICLRVTRIYRIRNEHIGTAAEFGRKQSERGRIDMIWTCGEEGQ